MVKIVNFRYFLHKWFAAMEWGLRKLADCTALLKPPMRKGIYLSRSNFGYTVQIDEYTLDLDVSYTKASELCDYLRNLREESV